MNALIDHEEGLLPNIIGAIAFLVAIGRYCFYCQCVDTNCQPRRLPCKLNGKGSTARTDCSHWLALGKQSANACWINQPKLHYGLFRIAAAFVGQVGGYGDGGGTRYRPLLWIHLQISQR